MTWSRGGGKGIASLCGSIAAACTGANLVCSNKTAEKITLDVFNWYEQTYLPTDITQKLANEKKFPVKKYKDTGIYKPTIANSPLCHISCSRFCKANEVTSGSKQRAERCARITADVAVFLVTQLNKQVNSKYEKEYALSAAAQSCRSCHAKGKTYEEGGFTRGKMDCQPCHGQDINVSENHYSGFPK